jgi:hypothetical protein
MDQMRGLVRFFIIPMAMIVASCASHEADHDPLVGTWLEGDRYYLRIYPDRRVAQWPSPPEGEVSWSRHSNGELFWGREGSFERNPRVERQGNDLVMKTSLGAMVLRRVPDVQPGLTISP